MITTDIAVIGAGPVGLFAIFEAGLLKMRCHLIDYLPQAGGQLSEIYPKKPIYDIPGYPTVLAQELVDNLLKQGWTDALRHLYPDEIIYTFWDYFRNAYQRNAGLRIDHLLLSPEILPQLKNAGVDKEVRGWDKSSDHAPVWVQL